MYKREAFMRAFPLQTETLLQHFACNEPILSVFHRRLFETRKKEAVRKE